MGRVADFIADLKIVGEGADKILRWASKSAAKRLLTFSLAGAAVTAGYYWHVDSLLEEFRGHNRKSTEETALVIETSRYQAVLDWAQLCLATREADETNRGWYCEQALALYEQRSEKSPPELRKAIIEKKAYGGIVVDMSNQLRGIELERLVRKTPSAAEEALKRLLSDVGVALLLIFLLVIMGLLGSLLFWYAKKSNVDAPPAHG